MSAAKETAKLPPYVFDSKGASGLYTYAQTQWVEKTFVKDDRGVWAYDIKIVHGDVHYVNDNPRLAPLITAYLAIIQAIEAELK